MPENELYKAALNKAMALCAGREVCSWEISSKLSAWGIDEESARKITEVLKREKFVDDARYATAYTLEKFRLGKWGRVKIAAALRMKKIPSELIRAAAASIPEDEYLELARNTIEIQRKKVKSRNKWEENGKLLRFATARGFESSIVYGLLNQEE